MLEAMPDAARRRPARAARSAIEGRVSARRRASSCVDSLVRGPVVIGAGARLENAFVGPYTSIGERCLIERCEIENSIVLADAEIRDIPLRIDGSLVGRNVKHRARPTASPRPTASCSATTPKSGFPRPLGDALPDPGRHRHARPGGGGRGARARLARRSRCRTPRPTSPTRRGCVTGSKTFRPDVVVNCAALHQGRRLRERGASEAFAVNGTAVGDRGRCWRARPERGWSTSRPTTSSMAGAATPYREDAATAPLSVYGESKLGASARRSALRARPGGAHELAVRVRAARTSSPPWRACMRGRQAPLRVVDDQVGGPTYTGFLARALLDLVAAGATGVVHYCNASRVSWYELRARDRRRPGTRRPRSTPVTTAEFPRPGAAAGLFGARRAAFRESRRHGRSSLGDSGWQSI